MMLLISDTADHVPHHNSAGSLATFTAMRRASSKVSTFGIAIRSKPVGMVRLGFRIAPKLATGIATAVHRGFAWTLTRTLEKPAISAHCDYAKTLEKRVLPHFKTGAFNHSATHPMSTATRVEPPRIIYLIFTSPHDPS
jgi:hypothetical protein